MELTYYQEMRTGELFAYGDFCEFFEMFDESTKTWQTSAVTYSRLLHDYDCTRISKEQAAKITGGILPEKAYEEYVKLFKNKK